MSSNTTNCKRWRQNHPEKWKECHARNELSKRKTPKRKVAVVRRDAKRRKRMIDLTDEHIIQLVSAPCDYCGFKGEFCNGIDRVDNNGHYTIDNSVPCCSICNKMKHVLDKEVFLTKVKCIYEHLNK